MIFATMKDGERVAARGGVYMRPIVRIDRKDESTYVRSHRWTRYILKSDGRTRVTGTGSANEVTPIEYAQSVVEKQRADVAAYRAKWPETTAMLREQVTSNRYQDGNDGQSLKVDGVS